MTGKRLRARFLITVVQTISVLMLLNTFCAATTEQTLFTFEFGDGAEPTSNLVADKDGNLYGTTAMGGVYERGTVFKLAHDKNGWKTTLVYSFNWSGGDGASPSGGLIFDSKGNLYGATSIGGASGYGTVFQLKPSAGGRWSEKILYSFTGGDDGSVPNGNLVFDKNGNLFGTAQGGPNTCITQSCGVVFELSPAKSGWVETVIYDFASIDNGFEPNGGLIFDRAGDLYGTTVRGGSQTCTQSCGTVFRVQHSKNGWNQSVLVSFTGSEDGGAPNGSLVLDQAGNLYGTTSFGGTIGGGVAFRLGQSKGSWVETVLYDFGEGLAGETPLDGLIFDPPGKLYGTSSAGSYPGYGAVFELKRSSYDWGIIPLYEFTGSDGAYPVAALWMDKSGNLFGTTSQGGGSKECEDGCGVVFEVSP
jgi:uncharacterized repeat protein (TIGR03803 family)